jgi:hypothetical protein
MKKRYSARHMSTYAGSLGQMWTSAAHGVILAMGLMMLPAVRAVATTSQNRSAFDVPNCQKRKYTLKRLLVAVLAFAMIIGLFSSALAANDQRIAKRLIQPIAKPDINSTRAYPCDIEWYDNAWAFLWTIPDGYGSDYYNMRFTNATTCTLKTVYIFFLSQGSNGAPGATVYLSHSDVNGMPNFTPGNPHLNDVCTSIPIPVVTMDDWTALDLTMHRPLIASLPNLTRYEGDTVSIRVTATDSFSSPQVFIGDFNVSVTPIYNDPSDVLSMVSDDGTTPSGRGGMYSNYPGYEGWYLLADFWNLPGPIPADVNLAIEVEKCCFTCGDCLVKPQPTSPIPALTAFNLPASATLVDSGNGAAVFHWIIAPKQYGTFTISFIASSGGVADTEDVAIQVLPRLPAIGAIAVNHDTLRRHVTSHTPPIDWQYLDFNDDDPQLNFEIAIGSDSDWTNAEMWNPEPFNSADTFVIYSGSPLVDGSTYWLRLQVYDSLGWSEWKQISFRMNSVPTIPQLRLPLAEAILPTQQPSLTIRNSTDAESDSLLYTFEVSPDNFATTVFAFIKKQDADSLTTMIVDSTLVENAQYWWRVKASDYYEFSEYSPIRSFWVDATNTAPTAVSLTQPANTIITPLTILRPQFVWTPATDPDPLDSITYDLVIAIDSSFVFTQQISNLTVTSHTLTTNLLWGMRNWWKVKSVDRHGAFNWSPVFTFRTMSLGDANNDGSVDISDAVYLIAYIFSGGSAPNPLMSGDASCDGGVDISDAVYLIAYIFSGGPAPCSAF